MEFDMSIKVVYIGNFTKIAEYIFHNEYYELISIICEKEKITEDLFTFSLVREIPILRVDKDNMADEYINKFEKNVVFVMCSYGKRLPIERCVGYQIFNIHYAALPKYKGRHPSYWATVSGEKTLGVSLQLVSEKFDCGDIITKKNVPYYLWENEIDVFDKLTDQVPDLLNSLNDYLNGEITLAGNSEDNYFPPVTLDDICLDIENDSPALIFNKVRSQTRANGAIIVLGNRKYRIYSMKFVERYIEESFVENNKLYIKYKPNICICSTDFKEMD